MTAKQDRPLTAKQERFPAEYLKDLCATKAAERAGYSPRSAKQIGYELLQNPRIAAEITRLSAERSQRTTIDADRVLLELWSIATADTNEIVQHRRTCCRFCYGIDHRWQYTQRELDQARDDHAFMVRQHELRVEANKKSTAPAPFSEKGGSGWDPRRAPNVECPECFGEGLIGVFIEDTRTLSPAARSLYAGVKHTREGVEVKVHDKGAALTLLGKHLKLFTDVVKHEGLDKLADAMRAAEERLANVDR